MANKAELLKCDLRRVAYTAQMEAVKTEFDGYSAAHPGTEAQLRRMKEKVDKFEDFVDELFVETSALCQDPAEFAPFPAMFKPLTDMIVEYKDRLWNCVQVIETQKATTAAAAATASAPAFKLERIKLPVFNGTLTDWQSFHDLFVTSIHNNQQLKGAEKLVHLKTYLTGDAAAVISSFSATDANYTTAWALVLERYNNKRELIFSHLRKFDNFKSLQTESASDLRKLSDTIKECLRSIEVLTVPVDQWDIIVIYYAMNKLDCETRKQWSLARTVNLPTLKEFTEFLHARANALTDSSSGSPSKAHNKKTYAHHSASGQSATLSCHKCSEPHTLFHCQNFGALTPSARKSFVNKIKACENCFRKGHNADSCTSRFKCQKCGGKHNTLLHDVYTSAQPPVRVQTPALVTHVPPPCANVTNGHCVPEVQAHHVVLLGTLVVKATDSTGAEQLCRAFLDPGSESHFISENCVDRLGLKRASSCVTVTGIGGASGEPVRGTVKFQLTSRVRDYSVNIEALILRKITGLLPRAPCRSSWPHLSSLGLSDPHFHVPGSIDILLGADIAGLLMLPDIIRGPAGTPTAQNTQFGWMLSGAAGPASTKHYQAATYHAACNVNGECDTLQRFWELEEPENSELTPSQEDKEVETHFLSTYRRNEDGGYTVELPFKAGAPELGHSRSSAVKRLKSVEARHAQDPKLWDQYIQGMRETLNANFMEPVPPEEVYTLDRPTYYMPHHAVFKPGSTTTKCRIVYDASAKTSAKVSLNDVLLTGPKLQVDLAPLLIRFRSHIVAMSSDIVKFYPQFRVKQEQADLQRLVWREATHLPIQDFRMLRLTFGVTTAPFLAIRCLHQLAEDERNENPLAADVIKEDFLVDNLLSGAPDVESALALQTQLLHVMKKGNLQLRKWTSNFRAVLNAVPPEHREATGNPMSIDETESIKTIGLLWNPTNDTFGVSIHVPDVSHGSTKRKVLSSIARIFDPLGWLSPVTVRPKALLQELWKANLDWDTPLPANLHNQWATYCAELDTLKLFQIPRCIVSPPGNRKTSLRYELHGFSDASLVAYSACVYLRTLDEDDSSSVILVAAKTKVAPVKAETIPRLELCGALLLSKLMRSIQEALNISFSQIRSWTDSTIVLGWLRSSQKLPIFVANRVRKIEAVVPATHWEHVPGTENPADPASRGISASSLVNHKLWLHGPPWLSTIQFPIEVISAVTRTETRSTLSELITRCSSFTKMKRVVGYCLRFGSNSKVPAQLRQSGGLTSVELNQALLNLVLCVQAEEFPDEISSCSKYKLVKSNLKFLAPFLDDNGVLRVGGRLKQSSLPFGSKHPMLLPRNHPFTLAMVRHYHLKHLHAAPQLLLATIRDTFWIVRGPDTVKSVVRKCVVCHRQNTATTQQIMGQLPSPRTTPSRPFSQAGVDYAGPFMLCLRGGRNPITIKSYISLFVCMSTRAIHLELVSDLTTPSFIAALKRFISRRGRPADIFCDGGLNFVGASNQIKEFMDFVRSTPHRDAVAGFLAEEEIMFHFNPPYAPHHGGIWEAGVKSMKKHLKRVLDGRKPSVEEFTTLLTLVEAALNSRPLSQMSADPNDFEVLTPGHFLIGASLAALPEDDLTHLKLDRLTRWQAMQQAFQHFWKRWHTEYLTTLQSRHKWYTPLPDLKPGILVLIRDDEPAWGPLKWKLGRITAVHPGPDGKTRVCDVITSSGSTYQRPIVKLSALPIYN